MILATDSDCTASVACKTVESGTGAQCTCCGCQKIQGRACCLAAALLHYFRQSQTKQTGILFQTESNQANPNQANWQAKGRDVEEMRKTVLLCLCVHHCPSPHPPHAIAKHCCRKSPSPNPFTCTPCFIFCGPAS